MKYTEVFLLVLAVCEVAGHHKKILRVADGESDCDQRFPYVGAFIIREYDQFKNVRYCTGSVIAPEWILTAGHCISDSILKDLHFAHGKPLTKLHRTGLIKVLRGVTLHYDKLGPGQRNDIGLAKVNPIKLNRYGKIAAIDSSSLIGYLVEYVGAGSTLKTSAFSDKKRYRKILRRDQTLPLQVAKGVVSKCQDYDSVPTICLVPKCGSSPRLVQFGDAGGPMVFKGKIIAIATKLNTETTAAKFTPVSPFLDWIKDNVVQKSEPEPVTRPEK